MRKLGILGEHGHALQNNYLIKILNHFFYPRSSDLFSFIVTCVTGCEMISNSRRQDVPEDLS